MFFTFYYQQFFSYGVSHLNYKNLDILEVFHVLFEQILKSPSLIYFLLQFVIYISQSDLQEFIKTLDGSGLTE